VIVTNDNCDLTLDVLSEWQARSKSVQVINLDGLARAYPNRVDRLAVARNSYLQALCRGGSYSSVVCVCDLDGPVENVDTEAIKRTLISESRWDVLSANQRQAYYDIYALRHPSWCPTDCWLEVEAATTFPLRNKKKERAISRYVHDRQFHIPPDNAPIPVLSAFGGLAFYRGELLRGCWYGSRDSKGRVVCEHVILHEQIAARSGKLFIAPSILNDAPSEHLGPGSGRRFPVKLFCE
jgi:hypothetical protein